MPKSTRDGRHEKSVENDFRKVKKEMINKLGRKALYGDMIDDVGVQLFRPWHGVNPQSLTVLSPGFQIINTHDNPGEHWVALYITRKKIYVYDSFGRTSTALLKQLVKMAKNKYVIVDSDHDQEQYGLSQVCGQMSLAWLIMVKKVGIKKALLI